jgi:hypothetical protein
LVLLLTTASTPDDPSESLPSISHLGCDREHKFGSCKSRHRGGDRENAELVFAIGGSAMKLALGRVDKLNPDSDAGKQHEGGEALDQLVVAGGDTA